MMFKIVLGQFDFI